MSLHLVEVVVASKESKKKKKDHLALLHTGFFGVYCRLGITYWFVHFFDLFSLSWLTDHMRGPVEACPVIYSAKFELLNLLFSQPEKYSLGTHLSQYPIDTGLTVARR